MIIPHGIANRVVEVVSGTIVDCYLRCNPSYFRSDVIVNGTTVESKGEAYHYYYTIQNDIRIDFTAYNGGGSRCYGTIKITEV